MQVFCLFCAFAADQREQFSKVVDLGYWLITVPWRCCCLSQRIWLADVTASILRISAYFYSAGERLRFGIWKWVWLWSCAKVRGRGNVSTDSMGFYQKNKMIIMADIILFRFNTHSPSTKVHHSRLCIFISRNLFNLLPKPNSLLNGEKNRRGWRLRGAIETIFHVQGWGFRSGEVGAPW